MEFRFPRAVLLPDVSENPRHTVSLDYLQRKLAGTVEWNGTVCSIRSLTLNFLNIWSMMQKMFMITTEAPQNTSGDFRNCKHLNLRLLRDFNYTDP